VAGLLLAASFPKISIAGLAWVAPGLMLLAAIGKPPRQTFRIGYVAGFVHFLASLYWLLMIPVSWFPILGWVALSAFLALGMGTWVWLSWKFFPTKLDGLSPASTNENLAAQFLSIPWASRTMWTISCAAIWVALEMVQARIFGGFPWNLLASSQYKLVPLIQIASITGIYGVSFLVVWTSLALLSALILIIGKAKMRSAWAGEIFLPALAVIAIYGIGYHKVLKPSRPAPEITVALVQPSIPQTLIWDTNENAARFNQLLKLSEKALTNKPDVMLWPEGGIPEMLRYDEATHRAVTEMARAHKVWMIVGSDDAEPRRNSGPHDEPDFFNSSFLVSSSGQLMDRYSKRNLVMFGEYIPLLRWMPFLKYVTPIQGGFTSGDKVVPFQLEDLKVKVSVLICFEDTFPQLVREYVSDDTDFLVNITNDGWFGHGAAQWQHAVAAIFRTVENGVPLVRCSNNGLTCWIDSCGRLREIFHNSNEGVYGQGFLIAHVPVLNPGETRAPTFYRLHGDVFGWSCVGFVVLRWMQVWILGRMNKKLADQKKNF
jgi:apolipoprotein N-acyltransferase